MMLYWKAAFAEVACDSNIMLWCPCVLMVQPCHLNITPKDSGYTL